MLLFFTPLLLISGCNKDTNPVVNGGFGCLLIALYAHPKMRPQMETSHLFVTLDFFAPKYINNCRKIIILGSRMQNECGFEGIALPSSETFIFSTVLTSIKVPPPRRIQNICSNLPHQRRFGWLISMFAAFRAA